MFQYTLVSRLLRLNPNLIKTFFIIFSLNFQARVNIQDYLGIQTTLANNKKFSVNQ